MIVNEDLGLVVAEDEDEKFWLEIKENTEKDIKNLKKMMKFQESILSMSEANLKNIALAREAREKYKNGNN